MKDLICNVELNGEGVWAQLKGYFSYSEFACNTVVNADVVSQTAQQIYDAVKKEDYKNTRYAVRITADFNDIYLKGLIDADYSEDFVPIDEPHYYDSEYTNKFIEEQRRELLKESIRKAIYENDYSDFDAQLADEPVDEYPYDLKGSRVEYDKDEVESYILSLYTKYFYDVNDDGYYLFDDYVNDKLDEIGFDELCKEKGIDVEIEYANVEDISVSYDGDSFLFRTYVILNFYERDDNE